jgi:hypothetical protein
MSCDVDDCTPAQKAQWCAGGKAMTADISKGTAGRLGFWATFEGLSPVAESARPVLIPVSIVKALKGYTSAYFD